MYIFQNFSLFRVFLPRPSGYLQDIAILSEYPSLVPNRSVSDSVIACCTITVALRLGSRQQ